MPVPDRDLRLLRELAEPLDPDHTFAGSLRGDFLAAASRAVKAAGQVGPDAADDPTELALGAPAPGKGRRAQRLAVAAVAVAVVGAAAVVGATRVGHQTVTA